MITVFNVLLMLAACIGNTEIWVMLTNRAYSFRIRHQLLRCFRAVMDLLILCYPVVLVTQVGAGSGGLLRGACFTALPTSAQVFLWGPVAAFPVWLAGVIRWQISGSARFHEADRREILRFGSGSPAFAARSSPVGIAGRVPWTARMWPFNEIFELEVSHKTIRVARTPADQSHADLRIVHLSDLHVVGCPGEDYYRAVVEQALSLQPHAFVFTGDLLDDPDALPATCEILSALPRAAPGWFVLGNHDWRFDHEAIRRGLSDAGWTSVAGRSVTAQINGWTVRIAGTELPWMGTAPECLDGQADVSMLLSHTPDQLPFAVREGFDVMVAGHTHGGQVVLPVIGPVFAPSWYGVKYASGLFHRGGVALHVSRGVGAKSPLRWNCRPELTCLTLKAVEPTSGPS